MTAPTTAEIADRIVAAIAASISQAVPLLPKNFTTVLAKAIAAVFTILFKRGDFIGLQWFAATASTQETTFNGRTVIPIVEIGRLIGVGDPTEATAAEILVDITVEQQGGVLDSGTQIIGASNGVTYILIGPILLDAPNVQGTFRAASDQSGGDGSGAQGNLDAGAEVRFANPLPGVARVAIVASRITTGADAEDLDTAYRQRVIDRFQKRPQGGALADYEIWAEEVEGILNAYPYTGDPGQVDVYSEATVASSGNPDGIPTVDQLEDVKESIEFDENGLASRRPANAFVNSLPITRSLFDVTVTDLADVNDVPTVEAAIIAAVEAYFLAGEPFINGLTVPPRSDRLTRSGVIGTVEDIVTAFNGTFGTATFELQSGGGPLESYTLGRGEKARAATVTVTTP